MRPRWRASVLAAAGAATLLAGCGIRVAAEPSPSPSRAATVVASAPASPAATPAETPAPPSASPSVTPHAGADRRRAAGHAGPRALGSARGGARGRDAARRGRRRRPARAARVRPARRRRWSRAAASPARPWPSSRGTRPCTSAASGCARWGAPDAVDDDTLFQLGAVSRAYTTTMLAALAGEGELRWDQPVRRVWPAFRLRDPWATREATFRDLTAGRSGLPAYAGDELRAFGYGRHGGAAPAALPAPGRRLPQRVRAAGRPGDGGGRGRGAGRRRLVGAPRARARARADRRRRHGARPGAASSGPSTGRRRTSSWAGRWSPRTLRTRRCSRRRSA